MPKRVAKLARYRVNANIGGLRHGEIVEIDPAQWEAQINAGWLSELGNVLEGDDEDAPEPARRSSGGSVSSAGDVLAH